MILFLTDNIFDMVQKLMNVVIVKDVVDSAKGPVGFYRLIYVIEVATFQIFLENFQQQRSVCLGSYQPKRLSNVVSKRSARSSLSHYLKKIIERSPRKYRVSCISSALSPVNMVHKNSRYSQVVCCSGGYVV